MTLLHTESERNNQTAGVLGPYLQLCCRRQTRISTDSLPPLSQSWGPGEYHILHGASQESPRSLFQVPCKPGGAISPSSVWCFVQGGRAVWRERRQWMGWKYGGKEAEAFIHCPPRPALHCARRGSCLPRPPPALPPSHCRPQTASA